MATVTVIRSIDAPIEMVFEAVAEARVFAQAISGVISIVFLSEMTSGVGTRFTQSRTMNGKEMTMDFEVTAYEANRCVRIVNETHGTVWDSLFTVTSRNGHTTLTMRMEARTRRVVPWLMNPLICILVKKAVERDIDAVKSFCEAEN